jgi:hypothetical protein
VASLASELAGRGHRVVIAAPSWSPELVQESRRRIRSQDVLPAHGEVSVLGMGELLPFGSTRRGVAPAPARRRCAHGRGAVLPDVLRRRARARALRPQRRFRRAAPFAGAERGNLPRAVRTGAVHPGRPPLRGALLRPARRPHRVLLRHAGAHGALLPCELPRHLAGGGGVERPAASERVRIAFCGGEERSALRLFLRALRQIPEDLDWEATVFTPNGAAPTLRSALRQRVHLVSGGRPSPRWTGPTWWSPPRKAPHRRPGSWSARSARGRCPWPPGCPPTRRSSTTESSGSCSSRATSTPSPRSSRA